MSEEREQLKVDSSGRERDLFTCTLSKCTSSTSSKTMMKEGCSVRFTRQWVVGCSSTVLRCGTPWYLDTQHGGTGNGP